MTWTKNLQLPTFSLKTFNYNYLVPLRKMYHLKKKLPYQGYNLLPVIEYFLYLEF